MNKVVPKQPIVLIVGSFRDVFLTFTIIFGEVAITGPDLAQKHGKNMQKKWFGIANLHPETPFSTRVQRIRVQ